MVWAFYITNMLLINNSHRIAANYFANINTHRCLLQQNLCHVCEIFCVTTTQKRISFDFNFTPQSFQSMGVTINNNTQSFLKFANFFCKFITFLSRGF